MGDSVDIKDMELKLLANVPIEIDGIGEFQLPILREVINMGESKYQEHYSRVLFDKSQLQNIEEDLSEYSDMEVLVTLIYHDQTFRFQVFNSLKIFLNNEPKMSDEGIIYFDELSDKTVLTEEKWNIIKQLIKIGNYIAEKKDEEDEYKAGNERAKKFMEKLRKKKAEAEALKKKVEKINTHSMISAVGWRLGDIDKALNKTVYQLYDAYYRFGFIDNFNFINTGIYTGNVDATKIKLPDINWANIIKI